MTVFLWARLLSLQGLGLVQAPHVETAQASQMSSFFDSPLTHELMNPLTHELISLLTHELISSFVGVELLQCNYFSSHLLQVCNENEIAAL